MLEFFLKNIFSLIIKIGQVHDGKFRKTEGRRK